MSEIQVMVVYALPERQYLCPVTLTSGANVAQAITQSGLLALHPEIDLTRNKVGIYGRVAKLSDVLQQGDRVEIYRPLLADPKELRRKRAARESIKSKSP